MQPSTHQTAPSASIARPPAGLLALVVAAGSASLFATYWDDAWHTDLGRGGATIPPDLLLYGSMAIIGPWSRSGICGLATRPVADGGPAAAPAAAGAAGGR
jgi:hypothetical protein